MADLNQLFPGSSNAEKQNLTYKPGEPIEFDGPSTLESVTLKVYGIEGGVALVHIIEKTKDGEYDIKLAGAQTEAWPADSTEEKPALAYEISGQESGRAKSIQVGLLLTEGYVEQPKEEPPPAQETAPPAEQPATY